jgi:hypothetical protein
MSTLTDEKMRQPYRLIVNNERAWMDVLTIRLSTGREVLPVFSHEEEADEFIRRGSWGPGWRVRETSARELVSVLLGSCPGVGWVALDPWPGIHDGMVVDLIGIGRWDFVDLLAGGIEASGPTARGDASGRVSRPGLRCSPGSGRRRVRQDSGAPAQAEVARDI